jgi:opacity protein-like surface antigen
MKFAKHIALLLAATVCPAALAAAADYEPPIVIDDVAQEVPVEIGSGWYLRGDLTYSANRSVYDLDVDVPFYDAREERFGGGGGIGYHFTDYLRADVNLAYVGNDGFDYSDALITVNAENEQWTGMANAYFDLGTISGFTPYIGAGVGGLYSRAEVEAVDNFGTRVRDNESQIKFAYTLNAGVSYQLAKNTSIDIGYQYLDSPQTEYLDFDSGTVKEGVDFHQVKVGLRYDLW